MYPPRTAIGPRRAALRLLTVVLGLAVTTTTGCSDDTALDHQSTDVLVLTLCTLRADHVGAYGFPDNVSPTIDALAGRGLLFERTLTGAPWTRPSIASMITGLYPRSLAIEERNQVFNDRALLDRFETLAERMKAAGYATIGVTANPNTNAIYNFNQGYDFYQDSGQLWEQGYDQHKINADKVIETLLTQVRTQSPDQRLFAHLVFVDVHSPFPQGLAERTTGFRVDGKTGPYATQVRYLDTMLGQLLAELHRLGRDNLLVVINSDHGEAFGLDPHPNDVGHGFYLYNAAVWVPFIIHHPALVSSARRIPEVVEMVDLVPTLLELLDIPFDPPSFDGRSLAAAIRDGAVTPPHPTLVTETAYGPVARGALLDNDWKLVVTDRAPNLPAGHGAGLELYRYRDDPTERDNRAEAERPIAERMYHALRAWQLERDSGAPTETHRVGVTPEAAEALRNLGYLVDDGKGKTSD